MNNPSTVPVLGATSDRELNLEHYDVHGNVVANGSELITTLRARSRAGVGPCNDKYRCIGSGNCGSVWAQGQEPTVLKCADMSETRYLWKEYYMATRVFEALQKRSALGLRIPLPLYYTNTSDQLFWSKQLQTFPSGRRACNTMCSERIPALSQVFRDTLIDMYCPEKARETIRRSENNADCLARIYLGRRSRTRSSDNERPSSCFSLRNYNLWLDRAEDLKLPIYKYAEAMADALAIMHWDALVDANDVEFVLGSRHILPDKLQPAIPSAVIGRLPYNSTTRWSKEQVTPIHSHRTTSMAADTKGLDSDTEVWLLDFDCCNTLTLDDAGIEQAVASFYRNDRYYPRPCPQASQDYDLWQHFRTRYLETSAGVCKQKGLSLELPRRFVDRLVAVSTEPGYDPKYVPDAPGAGTNVEGFYKAFVDEEEGSEDVVRGYCRRLNK